jgi:Protein of unknown function (DUF3124)
VNARALLPIAVLAATLHCGGEQPMAPELAGPRNLKVLDAVGPLAVQRTVYVPIYSSLHISEHVQPIDLGATLSLRNISERASAVILAVDYYDSDGKLVRAFLDKPAELGPLMSAEFFVSRADRSGGSGANFLVRWGLPVAGPDLLVEAVMHGRDSTAGVSFVTEGRIVETVAAPK